jgi:hypothetical protein
MKKSGLQGNDFMAHGYEDSHRACRPAGQSGHRRRRAEVRVRVPLAAVRGKDGDLGR